MKKIPKPPQGGKGGVRLKRLKYLAIAAVAFALLIGLVAPVSAKATRTSFKAVLTLYPGQVIEREWYPDGNMQFRGAEGYANGAITIGEIDYECEASTIEDASWNVKEKGDIVTLKGIIRGRMMLEFNGGSFEIRYITIIIIESGVLQTYSTNGEGRGTGAFEGQKMKVSDSSAVILPPWTWVITYDGVILSP